MTHSLHGQEQTTNRPRKQHPAVKATEPGCAEPKAGKDKSAHAELLTGGKGPRELKSSTEGELPSLLIPGADTEKLG